MFCAPVEEPIERVGVLCLALVAVADAAAAIKQLKKGGTASVGAWRRTVICWRRRLRPHRSMEHCFEAANIEAG
jgi:hypothetical protein